MANGNNEPQKSISKGAASRIMVQEEREFIREKLNANFGSNKDLYSDLAIQINLYKGEREADVTSSLLKNLCYIDLSQIAKNNGSLSLQANSWQQVDIICAYILKDETASRHKAIEAHIIDFKKWYPNDSQIQKLAEAKEPLVVLPIIEEKKSKKPFLLRWVLALVALVVCLGFGSRFFFKPASVKVYAPKPVMQPIEGDTFRMGNPLFNETYDDESVYTTIVSPFLISETEITFGQFDAFCNNTNRPIKESLGAERGSHPVIFVSWDEAVEYCNWLSVAHKRTPVYNIQKSAKTGELVVVSFNFDANGYRLPTEAEWELAASVDNAENRQYLFGNGKNRAYYSEMNFDANSEDKDLKAITPNKTSTGLDPKLRNQTSSVMAFERNHNQLYGMAGNVQEWCHDIYEEKHLLSKNDTLRNPTGATKDNGYYGTANYHVLKGGSWNMPAFKCRVAYREAYYPCMLDDETGFRIVCRGAGSGK